MKVIDRKFPEDICIGACTVTTLERLRGKTVIYASGRIKHGILYIQSGEAKFWSEKENSPITVRDGELLVIPKNQKYKMQYTASSTSCILVNLNLFTPSGEELSLCEDITVVARNTCTDGLVELATRLEIEARAADSLASSLRLKELIYRMLSLIYRTDTPLATDSVRYPQIHAGVQLLEQTYLSNLPIERFAQASNVSLSTFRHLFSKQYGQSPMQYRNRLRIERAKRLLLEGSYSVSEAAYACGFENIGYFCRYYKRVIGETPGDTRKCKGTE